MRHYSILGLALGAALCGTALLYPSLETTKVSNDAQTQAAQMQDSKGVLGESEFETEEKNTKSEIEVHQDSYDQGWEEGEHISERMKHEIARLADPATGQIPPDAHLRELDFVRRLPARTQVEGSEKGATLQSFAWKPRGPFGTGGRTRALAIDLENERTMFAGGVTGGLWRSDNGGESWAKVQMPDGAENISCIVQDTRPGKRNVWYLGTGEIYTAFFGTGVYKSLDGGKTWRNLASTRPNIASRLAHAVNPWGVVIRLVIDHTNQNQDIVYAAVGGNIMRSSDGGDSWTSVLGNSSALVAQTAQNSAVFTDVAISAKGTLYAALSDFDGSQLITSFAEQSGIWRSADGLRWANISPTTANTQNPVNISLSQFPTLGVAQTMRIVLATAPNDDATVYALRDLRTSSGVRAGLLRYTFLSGNGAGRTGGVWTDYSSQFAADFNSQTGYCMALKVKPDDAMFVVAGGVYAYTNPYNFRYRETTFRVSSFPTNVDITPPATQSWADHHDFVFLPSNPNVMYAANDGGIYRTEDCTRERVIYTPRNSGYITTQYYGLAINKGTRGDETIIGGMQDNGTRIVRPNDETGRLLNGADGVQSAISDGGRYYYASTQFANIFRMELDAQGRRRNVQLVSPSAFGFSRFFLDNPYQLDPNNQGMMYLAGGTALWRNANLTATASSDIQSGWGSIGTVGTDEIITSFGVSRNPANVVYVGTSRGRVYRMDDANDSKRVFRSVTSGLPANNGRVSCVAIDPTNADWAIAVFSNYNVQSIFSTTNGGQTWVPVGGNLEETIYGIGGGPSVAWVKIAYVGGKIWYLAGTSVGLFSTDKLQGTRTRWMREGAESIGIADVRMVDVRESDGFVAVATHGRGLFSSYLPTQTRRFNSETPAFTVGQSYPNPAPRTEVTIPMFLPRSTRITLTLWNVLGQAVMRPLEADMTAGEQFYVMPTSGIASGVYVYRVETSDGEARQGTIVIRQ